LTIKNIETLLAGKTTVSYVLKDKSGGKFKAKMKMKISTQSNSIFY